MGNELRMDKQQTLYSLFRLGWSIRKISRETKTHRTTVLRYQVLFQSVPQVPTDDGTSKPLQTYRSAFQSVPEVPADSAPVLPAIPVTNSHSISLHRAVIVEKLSQGLTAQRVYQDLVDDHAYTGSYDSIKRYARKFKRHAPKWFERLTTSPGREAQVDFGKAPCTVLYNGRYRHPHIFKITLSHSKMAYAELVWKQDIETWIRCHERAFRFFGGVPETVKLDNLKAGVITPDKYEPVMNQVYAAYASHAGFVPLPCTPYQPNQKGRVEHDVGYTQSNGLAAKRFESLDEANIALRHWNKKWASTRIHGTTRIQVQKMFDTTERTALKPLPQTEFPLFKAEIRKVDVNGCVAIARNFYSVPCAYVGSEVLVHFNSDNVKVLDKNTQAFLVQHKTLQGLGKLSAYHENKPAYAMRPKEEQEVYYLRKSQVIGTHCFHLINKLLTKDEFRGIYSVRGILGLANTFSNTILNEACSSLNGGISLSYRHVKKYCTRILEAQEKEVVPKLTQCHEIIRGIEIYQQLIDERELENHG
jgi:transposase